MKIINSIRIKYFRSILNTTRGNIKYLPTSDLNIIVGSNDAGKSNYLRALNLFFNNETDANKVFNFHNDFSYQRQGVRREESRVEIELIIEPPKKQNFKNEGNIKWTKIWKDGSTKPEEYFEYINGFKFTANYTSSYYKWLKKIKFKYIPAIKTKEYFDNLLYNLYDVLQKDTKQLENDFNSQVKLKTNEISNQINTRLNIESILQFTGSFRELFNSMKFGSIDGKYMLDQMGDGVKVRHIPIILQNIADEELKETRNREPIANTIWGFEEPENNLEFLSAKKLADTFLEYIENIHFENKSHAKYDEGIQIFITTHSPIFYTISNTESDKIQSFFVSKQNDNSSNIKPVSKNDNLFLEENMDLMPLLELSTHWNSINDKLSLIDKTNTEIKEHKNRLSELSNNVKCFFLTEDEKIDNLKNLLKIHDFNLEETEIISYYGVSNMFSTALVLGKHLKNKFPNAQLVLHRDRDYLTHEQVERERIKIEKHKHNLSFFITSGTDIESIFINVDYLNNIFKIEKSTLETFIYEATKEQEESSLSRFYKYHFEENRIGPSHAHQASKEVDNMYKANIERYRYGKKVLSSIKSKIQKNIGSTPIMIQKSNFIEIDMLRNISSSLWPKT